MAFFSLNASAQDITALSATATPGGVDINVQTLCTTVHSYLERFYTLSDNVIYLNLCYYVSPLTTVTELNEVHSIPIAPFDSYIVNVTIYASDLSTTCDYNRITSVGTYTLSTTDFESAKNSIKVFPNPTKGDLQIEAGNLTVKTVNVYNLLGQLVKSSENLQNNLSDLENGSYFAVIETDSGTVTKKIILQK